MGSRGCLGISSNTGTGHPGTLTAIRHQTPPVDAPIFTLFSHVHWFTPYHPPGVQYDFPKRPGKWLQGSGAGSLTGRAQPGWGPGQPFGKRWGRGALWARLGAL